MTAQQKLEKNYERILNNIDKVITFLNEEETTSNDSIRSEFLRLYNLYHDLSATPKAAKEPAYKHFLKLKKKERAVIEERMRGYIKDCLRNKRYVMYFRTYLANREFETEYSTPLGLMYEGTHGQTERIR
jgi:hypothetical protein